MPPPLDPPDPAKTIWFYFEYPATVSSADVRIRANGPPKGYRAYVKGPGSTTWTEITSAYDKTILGIDDTFQFAADQGSGSGPDADAIYHSLTRGGKSSMDITVTKSTGSVGKSIHRPNGSTTWVDLTVATHSHTGIVGAADADRSIALGWQF